MFAWFLATLALASALPSAAAESGLLEKLRLDQAAFDSATGTVQSLNRVKLLHLGKNSTPARIELLREAKEFVFVSVPYWYGDSTGEGMYNAFAEKIRANPRLDLRVLEDWTSPGSTGDLFGLKMFRKLKELTGGNAILWNTPYWGRQFSPQITHNRLHDKLFIVDGKRMIMGGMNIGDSYLQGGTSRRGWHDTDILVEGPAVAAATQIFLKVWAFSQYFSNPLNVFPARKEVAASALRQFFHHGRELFRFLRTYLGVPRLLEVRIPYLSEMRAKGVDPAQPPKDIPEGVPLRLIYDNPLFNQPDASGRRPVCGFQCALAYLLHHTEHSARLFMPYLTLSPAQEALLVSTAKRGVEVELITNSLKSHDIGRMAYFASLSHYIPLLQAGVRIFEWQGHSALEELEQANGCSIPEGEWPGKTLHTKAVILDGLVGVLGSHNMNMRSESFNSEVMAIVADPGFASELNSVFENDLDLAPARTVRCGAHLLPRSRRVEEIKIGPIRAFIQQNWNKIQFDKRLQPFI